MRLQAARQSGDSCAQHERSRLELRRVLAEGADRHLIVTDRLDDPPERAFDDVMNEKEHTHTHN
jgi:hypothetical protein